MTYLAGEELRKMGIGFVSLHGGVPSRRRGKLIEEFDRDPGCKVFLSTDAGGVGLNLQVASAVINFEPPWNPARATDRSGQQTSVIQQKFRRVGHDLCIAHVLLSCHESMIQTKARWRSPGSRAYFFSACAGFQTTQDRQSTRDWRGCRVAFLLLGMKSAS
jgi:hypothetical protein